MRRSLIRSVATVVVLFVAFAFLPLRGDHWWVGAILGAVLLATIVPLAISRLRRVLTADRPGFEAAEALVQLVAMLITGFAAVLYAMNRNGTQLTGLDTRVDAIYFTVTVLSTVGFGDIHATSQAAADRGDDPDPVRPGLPGCVRPHLPRRRQDARGRAADPRTGRRLEQAELPRDADGIVPVIGGELLVDVLDVGLDGVGRHEERTRDLGVRHAGG